MRKGLDTNWIIVIVCVICGTLLSIFSYVWYFLIERALWTSTLKKMIAKNAFSNPDHNQAQHNTPAIVYPQYPSQQILNGWVASAPPQVPQDPRSRQPSINPQNLY